MNDIIMETYTDSMVDALSRFIKINTVKDAPLPYKPYGKGVFDGLMFIQSLTDKLGLDCVNMFGHLVYVDYGSGDETLAILTHTDVVPPGDGWTRDPFSGDVEDGKVHGRGAIDDKGAAIAALFAVKALSDNCVDLNRKVRIIFGGDEESGSQDIAFYREREPDPEFLFSPDGDFPIVNCEKGLYQFKVYARGRDHGDGMSIIELQSGTRVNVVPNKAYCILNADFDAVKNRLDMYQPRIDVKFDIKHDERGVRIEVEGKSAHGSAPHLGINAAAALICFLNTLPLSHGTADKAVRAIARVIGTDTYGEGLDLAISDEVSGKLTVNLGVVDFLNDEFSAQIDIRFPVCTSVEHIAGKVAEHMSDVFDIELLHGLAPHFVPESTPIIDMLKEAYEEVTREKAYCLSLGGATYAHTFDNGVTFGPVFPGKPFTGHGPDEYIEIDDLVKLSQIILNAILKICG